MTCYITQDDRLQLLLTVMENMRIACDFKLGSNVPKHEKEGRVSLKQISLEIKKKILKINLFPD